MQPRDVDGLAQTYSLFDAIPESARNRLAAELGLIATDVLAAQRSDVAKRTGELSAGLSEEVQIDELRARVGLLGIKGGRSKLFYGRIVEAGRRAQVVLVQRRRRGGGKLRLGPGRRKRAEDIAATYSLRVSPLPPRPFVHVDRPEIRAEERLAGFWAQVISDAGGTSA
jgi:hypothetical protein